MTEKVEHTALRIERSIPQDGYECYFLYEGYRKNGMYTRKAVIEGPQTDDRTQWFESIALACNSYPALLAERDRLLEALAAFRSATSNTTYPKNHPIWRAIELYHAALKDTNQ